MDTFSGNSERVRKVVNREGDGASRGDTPQMINAPIRTPGYCIDVREKPGRGSETTIGHTGPNAGVAIGGAGSPTDVQGFVSPTGNRVTIDNNMGSDVITMHHHTGATVMIDADGSIHIISVGKKGFGLVAPKGDGAIMAQGHIIIKGDSKITLETNGDLDLNVGGNFDIYVAGDMSTYVEGSIEQFTDGRLIQEVVKDHMITVAGDARTTVAGESRNQITGNYSVDVGKVFTARADQDVAISGIQNVVMQSKGSTSITAKEDLSIAAAGDLKATAKGTMTTHSTGNMDIRSSSRVDVNEGGASPIDPGAVPLAQYAPPETIIDNMTTVREAPDFPKNAMRMPDSKMVLYKMDGDTINPKAEAAARGNDGAGAPHQNQERSGETIPTPSAAAYDKPQGISGSGRSEQNPLPVPSSALNSNQKISRHLTVGQVLDIRSCSPDQFQSVIKEAMNTAWNCMDPLIEKYGSRVRISSWFRKNTKNHGTGGAIDFSAMPRGSHDLTAEMAAFLRDNTPTRQLFLEKNNQGGIHCHVWASPVGQGSTGNVLTCADPQCRSKVAGIVPSYAKAALGIRSA